MNQMIKNLVEYAGIALSSYTALLAGAQILETASEKITSKNQLDMIVEEEARKLNMDPRLVLGVFYEIGSVNYDRIRGARCYIENFHDEPGTTPIKVVEIKEGSGARRAVVRHELYHLKKHLPKKGGNFLKYFFYEEPTATLYALTGIKIGCG